MPLDKKTFELAKDLSPLIIAFLKKEPNNAYVLDEIIDKPHIIF